MRATLKATGAAIVMLLALMSSPAEALIGQHSGNQTSTPVGDDLARLVTLHQQARAEHGLRSLVVSPSLSAMARPRATDMANAFAIWHDYGIGQRLPSGHVVGENVGRGPSVDDIFAAFMASPEHRSNILDPRYNSIGLAVAYGGDDSVYVEVLFLTGSIDPLAPAVTHTAEPPTAPEHAVTMLVALLAMDAS